MKLHHATVKKAKSFKIDLIVEEGEVVASRNGVRLASGLSGSVILEQAIAKLGIPPKSPMGVALKKVTAKQAARKAKESEDDEPEEGADDDLGGDDDEGQATGSIVKRKYRDMYKPHKGTCGDDLAFKVRDHLMVENDAGEMRIDRAALKRFAEANGCWDKKYADCNNGVARMSITNRLRAKTRKGIKVIWS